MISFVKPLKYQQISINLLSLHSVDAFFTSKSLESHSKFNMGNPNKDSDRAMGDLTSPHMPARRDAALAKQVAEAIARETA